MGNVPLQAGKDRPKSHVFSIRTHSPVREDMECLRVAIGRELGIGITMPQALEIIIKEAKARRGLGKERGSQ